ncbi:ATP-dependent nuclease [Acidovorax sp.]|jgi:hypothetical protein|uniref:ATP-dependent nuclease n=1 Tax=Acidovorax sp. TaxID=1872122 RepID=UPI00391F416B
MVEAKDKIKITSVTFRHYKGLARYSISLDSVNILTGANNSGKSTIVGAFRILAVALRTARTRSPQRVTVGGFNRFGYVINASQIPLSLENVATNYVEGDSHVAFRLSNGNHLHLYLSQEGCVLVADANGVQIKSPVGFKSNFPLNLVVIPVLGPVEHREQLREKDTVSSSLATHRASLQFRSYWYHFPEDFEKFANLVESTWPGMQINRPSMNMARELTMFVKEGRIDRELYWVGFGFQIWCQLLSHINRASEASMIVVDEPEVYLHPDVQRRLLGVLKNIGPDVVVATHSTEIISEADPTDIVLIDKTKASAERIKDISGVQKTMVALGSQQNISLAALARNRRVLFVEGDYDFSLLRRFARRLGLDDLGAGIGLAAMPSGGFGSWSRISALAQGVEQALGTELLIGAIYDRDYFCDEQISEMQGKLRVSLKLSHVHARKEMENYLLVPAALDRVMTKGIAERKERGQIFHDEVKPSKEVLMELSKGLKDDSERQYVSRYVEFHSGGYKDLATKMKDASDGFRLRWSDPNQMLSMVGGKDLLRLYREHAQKLFGVSLTDAKIIDAMRLDEIPGDLVDLLNNIEAFRKAQVAS